MALSEAKSTGREHRSTFEGCDHGRRFADETGALLVFDEMMTGFRIAYGGARERFDVTPDLTALGAVIGGGLPLAAHGNAEIGATLDHLDRAGAAALTGRN